ncbi:MAG TPA: cytochrome c biogenesis heme-transporting ATPase CcmA [Burkholderiaceae bacterium]|nr:cytochrome c biogenesis heme-transporting ATPase CcmA [Burkholderiaceae bacterium]
MFSTSSADVSTSEPARPTPVLTAHALGCRRGDRLLFAGFELEIHPGQVIWVRGANGRGKTSLLRLLAGLASPEQGEIKWTGTPNTAAAHPAQRLVYIGHSNALKDDLTALESLQFMAQLHRRPAGPQALEDALRRCGMQGHRHAPVRTLSQGQRRRVALARLCLETEPLLWILDEPFDALDVQGVETLNSLLSSHAQRGGSAVLTSHLALSLSEPQPIAVSLDNAPA